MRSVGRNQEMKAILQCLVLSILCPGDHIRLQNVNVGYTLPLSIGAKSYPLGISANLSNMGILWKKTRSTLDPDFRNDIPNPRSYALNLQLNF